MSIAIEAVTEDRPDLLERLAAVRTETDAEINPDDPPAPVEELAAEVFVTDSSRRRWVWVADLDDEPAGELTLVLETEPENRHIAEGEWLAVRPSMRRHGVADALLRTALELAAGEGCTSLMMWSPVLEPDVGASYAQRLGLTERSAERCSRMRVADLDAPLVDDWLAEGRRRTDGYRIVQWVGPAPDEHVEALVEAHVAMEDMPIDELEWHIPAMTVERVRSRDDAWQRGGRRNVTTLALAADGRGAGLSELQINTHRPTLAAQGDTGVRAEHRGRGLGRWLKAENLRLALATEPRIEVVETYNAQSNPWMLDINVAMGFRPHVGYRGLQGELDRALRTVS